MSGVCVPITPARVTVDLPRSRFSIQQKEALRTQTHYKVSGVCVPVTPARVTVDLRFRGGLVFKAHSLFQSAVSFWYVLRGMVASGSAGLSGVCVPVSPARVTVDLRSRDVFKAHRLCVSLNSRLESNKEKEKEEGVVGCLRPRHPRHRHRRSVCE